MARSRFGIIFWELHRPEIGFGANEFNLYVMDPLGCGLRGDHLAFGAAATLHVLNGELMPYMEVRLCSQYCATCHYELCPRLFAVVELVSYTHRQRHRNASASTGPVHRRCCVCTRGRRKCTLLGRGRNVSVSPFEDVGWLHIVTLRHFVLSLAAVQRPRFARLNTLFMRWVR